MIRFVILFLLIGRVAAGAVEYERPPINLDFENPRVSMVAGIRPYRKGGIRIEHQKIKDVHVIHNYGHGGAGITLSWGTVEEAIALAEPHLDNASRILVVGAGVVGLTTAYELNRLGYAPTLYAAKFIPDITSNVAGGLWKPASVDLKRDPNPKRVKRYIRRSFERYGELKGFPVKRMPYFRVVDPNSANDNPFGLDALAKLGLTKPIISLDRLPIEGVSEAGKQYDTFLIDTPRYMKRLFDKVKKENKTVQYFFESQEDLIQKAGRGSLVFNCTGFGSRKLFSDKNVIPIRGQLVLVERDSKQFPPSDGDFMVGFGGYYFPREKDLVLGGTFEQGKDKPIPDPEEGRKILARHKKFFGYTP